MQSKKKPIGFNNFQPNWDDLCNNYGLKSVNFPCRFDTNHKIKLNHSWSLVYLFIYLGFYVTFNTVQVISPGHVMKGQRKSVHTVGQGSVL